MFLRSRTTYVGPKLAALSLRGPSGSARGTESDLDLVVRPLVWKVDSVVSQEVERRFARRLRCFESGRGISVCRRSVTGDRLLERARWLGSGRLRRACGR